jgi:hypothetical protein
MPANITNKTAKGQWVDGVYFRSIVELARYRELRRREQEGLIHDLECQPKFLIRHPETGEKVCTYIGDFRYRNDTYNDVVEDVKGIATEVYRLKARLVRIFLGVHITEIRGYARKRNKQIVGYRWKVNGAWE